MQIPDFYKETTMRFGYFTLTDNPPAYGAARRPPNQFLLEVLHEGGATEKFVR